MDGDAGKNTDKTQHTAYVITIFGIVRI